MSQTGPITDYNRGFLEGMAYARRTSLAGCLAGVRRADGGALSRAEMDRFAAELERAEQAAKIAVAHRWYSDQDLK